MLGMFPCLPGVLRFDLELVTGLAAPVGKLDVGTLVQLGHKGIDVSLGGELGRAKGDALGESAGDVGVAGAVELRIAGHAGDDAG